MVADIVKELLQWMVVTAAAFLWWMAVLLLCSLFLLNVWHVTFEEILKASLFLMIITSAGYLGRMVYRRRRG